MIGKVRTLAIALTAVAALGTTMASGAQAGALDIGATPAVITGQSLLAQDHVFSMTTTAGAKFNIRCPAASFEGTTQGQVDVTELTLTATYGGGCTAPGIAATTVVMNGCKYTVTGSGQPALTALVDIVGCTAGKKIELKMLNCTFTVGEQLNLSHVVFDTTAVSPQDVDTTFTLTGIHVIQDGAGCPDGNNHTSLNLTLTSSTTTRAFSDLGTAIVTKHGHQYSEHLEGAQVGLLAT